MGLFQFNHLVFGCKSLRSTHWNGGLPESGNFILPLSVSSCPIQTKLQTGCVQELFASSFHLPIGPFVLVKEQAKKALKWWKELSFWRIQTALGWILTLSLISCVMTSLNLGFKMRIEIPISWVVIGTKCGSGCNSAL